MATLKIKDNSKIKLLPNTLKMFREMHELSAQEFADLLHIDITELLRYENYPDTEIAMPLIQDIAHHLDVDPSDIAVHAVEVDGVPLNKGWHRIRLGTLKLVMWVLYTAVGIERFFRRGKQ